MIPPYNRALHPDDLKYLPIDELDAFERQLMPTPYRKDHGFRSWEYGLVLKQLRDLQVPLGARILDTGSGGSFLPPLLAKLGYKVTVSDSMHYGDITEMIIAQCHKLGILLPILKCSVEDMEEIPDNFNDVTLCISVIEHVGAELFAQALSELIRVTKPGGYMFITSDYFESNDQWMKSPFKQIQHTAFNKQFIMDMLDMLHKYIKPVGDLYLDYRGNFVHNYSFVNLCLQKL